MGDETFHIHARKLQKFAFGIRCELDILIRGIGSTFQFFIDRKIELALKKVEIGLAVLQIFDYVLQFFIKLFNLYKFTEKGIMSCFYNTIFEGHFRISPKGFLILYMHNMEFKQESPIPTANIFSHPRFQISVFAAMDQTDKDFEVATALFQNKMLRMGIPAYLE